MKPMIKKYTAVAAILTGTALIAVNATIALFEKQQVVEASNEIISLGARNDEIFLSRKYDKRDNVNTIVWDSSDSNYSVWALVYNNSLIEQGHTSEQDKGTSYDWIEAKTVSKSSGNITITSGSVENTLTSDDPYYCYFDFNNIIYDRFEFHRIRTDAVCYTSTDRTTFDANSAGHPYLFYHKYKSTFEMGMAAESTHTLSKPIKNNVNVYQIDCWNTTTASDYIAWEKTDGSRVNQALLSTVDEEIIYDDHDSSHNASLTVTLTGSMHDNNTQLLYNSTTKVYSKTQKFYNNDAFIVNVTYDNVTYTYGYSSIESGQEYCYYGQTGDYIKLNQKAEAKGDNLTISFNPVTKKITIG